MLVLTASTAPRADSAPSLHYQGRISVNNLNFDGTGLFKFAIVNAAGDQAYWSNDGTTLDGSEPQSAVSIAVARGLYSVPLGDASIPNMASLPADLFDNEDLHLRVWFDDGVNGSEHLAPDQPLAAVAYAFLAQTVADGAITSDKIASRAVRSGHLGNNSVTSFHLANGAVLSFDIADGAITGPKIAAGAVGNDHLEDRVITADKIASGAINAQERWDEVAPNAALEPRVWHSAVWTGSEVIVWGGSAPGMQMNSGGRYDPATNSWQEVTTEGAPGPRNNHTAVWTGTEMIVWGGRDGTGNPGTNYFRDGARYNPVTDSWIPTNPIIPAIPQRARHVAVWTGTEMLVWGGENENGYAGSGYLYDPDTDQWRIISGVDAPWPRVAMAAVWTGEELLIWSGSSNLTLYERTGWRYNPSTDLWTEMSSTNAPLQRRSMVSIWTGAEMVIWGGYSHNGLAEAGGRYNPATDTWAPITTAGAPPLRGEPQGIWTGSEMIVWGGSSSEGDGGRYDPQTDTWRLVPNEGGPSDRWRHSLTWTGSAMLVWGGFGSDGFHNGGSRYYPYGLLAPGTIHNVHLAPNAVKEGNLAPGSVATRHLQDGAITSAKVGPAAITASQLAPDSAAGNLLASNLSAVAPGGIVLSEDYQSEALAAAGYTRLFNAILNMPDDWEPTSTSEAPEPRRDHTAIWTGSKLLVWGGAIFANSVNTGGIYDPVSDTWTEMPTVGAPSPRSRHTAVWTGSRMIIWGGYHLGTWPDDGGVFDPATMTWSPIEMVDAPEARDGHSAVWTGSEMIIWGGQGAGGILQSGARYDPETDSWTEMLAPFPPPARIRHSSVWTGSRMIIFGGTSTTSPGSEFNIGVAYDPDLDEWTLLPSANTPFARESHTAVWTGTDMLVWGGKNAANGDLNSGGAYDPIANRWTDLEDAPLSGVPSARSEHTAVWTGRAMVVWGGVSSTSKLNSGGVYFPDTDTWIPTSFPDNVAIRNGHTATWSGRRMTIWGGSSNSILDTGTRYTPPRRFFLFNKE